uniref:Uncharacterized protein n=1 Tax=Clytia hemisphaerica TaxID=252671 RepID=A0A7M5XA78_9CNID
QPSPSKRMKHSDEVSGFVINCLDEIVKTQSKPNNYQSPKKSRPINWFNFGLVTENKRYRCVSFCPHHIDIVKSVNNSKTYGLKLTNVEFTGGEEYKLNIESRIEKIELHKKYDPAHAPFVTLSDLYGKEFGGLASIKCKVTKVEEFEGKVVRYEYICTDPSTSITLSSFQDLKLQKLKNYSITDLTISHFSNELRLQHSPITNIIELKKAEIKLDSQKNIKIENVNITSLTKPEIDYKCKRCDHFYDQKLDFVPLSEVLVYMS